MNPTAFFFFAFFHSVFAESRMQRRYFACCNLNHKMFYVHGPSLPFFCVFGAYQDPAMKSSQYESNAMLHFTIGNTLGEHCGLVHFLFILSGETFLQPCFICSSTWWGLGNSFLKKKKQFYMFTLLISIHLCGFDVCLVTLLKFS